MCSSDLLYMQIKEFDKALAYYNRIVTEEGLNDPSLEKEIADTNLRKFDYQISQIDPNVADYADQLAKLQTRARNF